MPVTVHISAYCTQNPWLPASYVGMARVEESAAVMDEPLQYVTNQGRNTEWHKWNYKIA